MDIDGLGEKLVEQLVDAEILTGIASVFDLAKNRDRILELERTGARSADKLIASVAEARQRPLWRLLCGMNIRHVGAGTSRALADHYGALDAILAESEEALAEVEDVGPIIAKSVRSFFTSPVGKQLVTDLRDRGVNFGTPVDRSRDCDLPDSDGVLTGKNVVVTGSIEGQTRDSMKELIHRHGGKSSSSVSRKTDYLVAGEKAGSKLQKAEKLDVAVLTPEEFFELLESGSSPE